MSFKSRQPLVLSRGNAETGEPLITAELIDRYCQLVRGEAGPDFWWSLSLQQILEGTGLKAASYRRGEDILDIWFDSGISWAAVIGTSIISY
jgi:isoleucyl-tRNA synthetase